jgi:protein-tyrosine phosphatase
MIDIHSHILFGVDDGAVDLDDALALAKIYAAAGYRQVVATPHARMDSLPSNTFGETIRGCVDQLNNYLDTCFVPLEILPGMEVGLDPLLPQMVAQGVILTLADSKYLLVETPFWQLPLNWWDVIFLLAARGTTVIFAHPERCAQVASTPDLLEKMARAGAKFQLNWDSFAGAYGHRVAQVARFMIRHGFVHCLATDSHNADRRNAACVRGIMSELEGLVGDENCKLIAVDNPARVVQDKMLLDMDFEKMPPSMRRKKRGGLMGIFAWVKG